MRLLACSSISLLLLAAACNPDDGDDDGGNATAMPGSTGSTGPGPGSDSGGTTEAPASTGPAPDTTTTASTTDTPADSSGSESGDTSAGGGDPGDWLLTIDNGTSPPRLVRADLTGGVVEVCTLAPSVNYTSLVFDRDGTLYGHNAAASRIDVINPCNCSFQIIGPTSLGAISIGLSFAGDDGLLALVPNLDALARVSLDTGLSTVVGPLGFIFEGSAIAWSDTTGQPYAIEGANDYLYSISHATGAATPLQPLTEDVTNPGLAVHPNDGGLYACSGNTLYTLNPVNGLMVPIGPLGLTGACQTLAAPQTALGCVDAL